MLNYCLELSVVWSPVLWIQGMSAPPVENVHIPSKVLVDLLCLLAVPEIFPCSMCLANVMKVLQTRCEHHSCTLDCFHLVLNHRLFVLLSSVNPTKVLQIHCGNLHCGLVSADFLSIWFKYFFDSPFVVTSANLVNVLYIRG